MIVIIDYKMGNIGSILNMLRKVGAKACVSSEKEVIGQAEKLILPGVGAFDHGMKNVHDSGLMPLLNKKVLEEKTPILGICLGMQLLGRKSEEGTMSGLGWINAETRRFKLNHQETGLKIPHIGWNMVTEKRPNIFFQNMPDEPRFYFVHSYHMVCEDEKNVLCTTCYGYDFASVVAQGNVTGVQFHPEKSHKFGLQLLRNFAQN